MPESPLAIVVLISGGGSNLQALIDAIERGQIPAKIVAVISNRHDAGGLKRAAEHGIPSQYLNHREFASREDFDDAMRQLIDGYSPGLVVLAGFMRILSAAFTEHYAGRLLNIHPSLLPKYKGLHTHQRALDNGDKVHGATVHFVTAELDGGPPVIQARVPITPQDTPQSLAEKVLRQEHIIYPQAVAWFAEGRLSLQNGTSFLDGKPLSPSRPPVSGAPHTAET